MTAFEKDEEQHNPKVGLKQNQTSSIFSKKEEKPSQKTFAEKIDAVVENEASNKQKIIESVSSLKKIFLDQTLPQNKNPIVKQMERDQVTEFLSLIDYLNKDQQEQEGAGSLVALSLLIPMMIKLKDKINELEYELSKLKEK